MYCTNQNDGKQPKSYMQHFNRVLWSICIGLAVVFPRLAFSQLTLTNPTTTQTLSICEQQTIVFEVRGVQAGAPVDITLNFPADLQVVNLPTGETLPTATWQVTPGSTPSGSTATLSVQVEAGCSFYGENTLNITGTAAQGGNTTSFNRVLDIETRSLTWLTTNKVIYYDNPPEVDLEQTVDRCYAYMNTQANPFTGEVFLVDSLEFAYDKRWVDMLDIFVGNAGGATISNVIKNIEDSVMTIQLTVENLPTDSVLTICSRIKLISCTPSNSPQDYSTTRYSLSYGCANDPIEALCNTEPVPHYTRTKRIDLNPKIKLERIRPTRNCPAEPDTHFYKIWNAGNGVATGFELLRINQHANAIWDLTNYDLDAGEVEIFTMNNGVRQNIPYTIKPNQYSKINKYHNYIVATENHPIHPGDTIYVRFIERKTCVTADNEEAYFDLNNVHMQWERLYGALTHPCQPSSAVLENVHWNQGFGVNQAYDNLVSTIGDNETLWLEVENTSNMWIGRYNNKYPYIYFDEDRFRFEIDLKLDPGMCFADLDSIYLLGNVNDTIIRPTSVKLVAVDSMRGMCTDSLCGGATVRLRFAIPEHFLSPSNSNHYIYRHLVTGKINNNFRQFFGDFTVRYKVRTECNCVISDEPHEVSQKFYAIYDTACAPNCRIPMGIAADKIQVNCPGCFVPGWNLTDLDILRENIGMADADDNHYPDAFPMQPANPNQVDRRRIMLGDTISIDIDAAISDGSPSLGGFTFQSAGFEYLFGEFILVGDLMSNVELINLEGTLINGYTENFSVSAQQLQNLNMVSHNGSTLLLMLDATDWNNLLSQNTFDRYWAGQAVNLRFTFVVTENLTSGIGANSYMGNYEVAGKYHMSGVDYVHTAEATSVLGCMLDALTPFPLNAPTCGIPLTNASGATINAIQDLDIDDRKRLTYWCTNWAGRVRGIGVDLSQELKYFHPYNICLKSASVKLRGATGQTAENHHDNIFINAYDAFPFELRNIWMLDSVVFDIPNGYKVIQTYMDGQAIYRDNNGISAKTVMSNYKRPISSPFILTNANTVTFNIADYLDDVSTEPILASNGALAYHDSHGNPHGHRSFYGESKYYVPRVYFSLDNCSDFPENEFDSVTIRCFLRNDPFNGLQDTVLERTSNFRLDRPIPNYNVGFSNLLAGVGSSDLTFDVNVSNDLTGNDIAPNSFIVFDATAGSIDITNVIKSNGQSATPSGATSDGLNIYNVGSLGTASGKVIVRSYSIEANYDCTQSSDSIDYLIAYVGYGCDGIVSDLSQACKIDTFYYPMPVYQAALAATLNTVADISTCDTILYKVLLDASGNSNVENVAVDVQLPAGVEVATNNMEGTLDFNGQNYTITPTTNGSTLTYALTPLDDEGFIGTNQDQNSGYLILPLVFDCTYKGFPITADVQGTDYCGKPLPSINGLEYSPDNITLNATCCDTCIIAANYSYYITEDCKLVTLQQSTSDAPITGYTWLLTDMYGVTFQTSMDDEPVFEQIRTQYFQLCLIIETDMGELCRDTLCKFVEMCCTDEVPPCELDGNIEMEMDDETCLHSFSIASTNGNSINDYNWTITMPSGQTITGSNSTIEITPTEAGLHQVQVVTGFTYGTEKCLDTLNLAIKLEPCTDPCDVEGSIELEPIDDCSYHWVMNTNVSNAVYTWGITFPDGTTLNHTGEVYNLVASQTGIYKAVVVVAFANDGVDCSDTLTTQVCLEACPDPCAFDGELEVSFDDVKCSVRYGGSGASSLSGVTYEWTVLDPQNNPVALSNANLSAIQFQPSQTGMYQVSLTITWEGADSICSTTLTDQRNFKACEDPCAFEGQLFLDGESCSYKAYVVDAPNGASFTWSVTDENGQITQQQASSFDRSFEVRPPADGGYTISVFISWVANGKRCNQTLQLNRCLKDCEE